MHTWGMTVHFSRDPLRTFGGQECRGAGFKGVKTWHLGGVVPSE